MARPKSKGAYVPLAAQYFMDDAILEAGPDAELLFVRVLSFLAAIPSDGFITDRQVAIVAAGLRAPQRRLDSLLNVGLIETVSGGFLVRSWLKWNRSADEVGKLLAKDRERKARKDAGDTPNSERNPDGFQTDSELQSRAEQSRADISLSNERDSRAKRGSRLEPDWVPSPESIAKIRDECPTVDSQREHQVFVDYWIAQPGQKGVKLDWDATWRNWMRRKQGDAGNKKLTPMERAAQTAAAGRRIAGLNITSLDPKEITV